MDTSEYVARWMEGRDSILFLRAPGSLTDIGKLDSAEIMRNAFSITLGPNRLPETTPVLAITVRDSHHWLPSVRTRTGLLAHPVLISDDC
jgi:hypothetical protein